MQHAAACARSHLKLNTRMISPPLLWSVLIALHLVGIVYTAQSGTTVFLDWTVLAQMCTCACTDMMQSRALDTVQHTSYVAKCAHDFLNQIHAVCGCDLYYVVILHAVQEMQVG